VFAITSLEVDAFANKNNTTPEYEYKYKNNPGAGSIESSNRPPPPI
jgi:hypothetical protein